MSERSGVGRALAWSWWLLEWTLRMGMTLLLLVVLIVLAALWWSSGPPTVPSRAALVIAPAGDIVEQLDGDAEQRAWDSFLGIESKQILLQDLRDAIEKAAEDDRIQALFLGLDNLEGAGLSKMQDLRATISDFKKTGKKVIASADFYQQNAYYLATSADEILLHPSGAVLLTGYESFRTYYKEGLDRLQVDWNVFRVGEYKSYVEPFTRNDMSDESRTATLGFLEDLWNDYLEDVAAARGQTAGELSECIGEFDSLVKEYQGDLARLALELGWVDRLTTADEMRGRMIELVGEDTDSHTFNQIEMHDYLAAVGRPDAGDGPRIGVLVASGEIMDGRQPPGKIGGDSTAELIRRARYDDQIKALILRVDSGGGSAFASEVIRRELELLREAGKPVVVSMGSVAASGGYWIATSSDRILASPVTITGSIGIFGMFPTFQRTLSTYLGLRVDGVGTTRFAGAARPDRALDPAVGEIIQQSVNHGYQEFLTRVAANRGKSVEAIDAIARGRVWSGQDAFELGLVDQLGNLEDAAAAAAELAKLGDTYSLQTLEHEISFSDQLLIDLLTVARSWIPSATFARPGASLPERLFPSLRQDSRILESLNDPRGIYAICWCEPSAF